MRATAPDSDELARWVADSARRVRDLVVDLDDHQLIGPLLPTVNPFLWEVGHIAWFQEKFVLRQACGHEPILPFGDALYDSGAIPHDTRWRLNLPSIDDTVHYLQTVADRVAEEVTKQDATDVTQHFARYTVHHHDTHAEAFMYTRQALELPCPKLPGLTDSDVSFAADSVNDTLDGDIRLSGGRFLLGANRGDPFVYDNEKWAHPVEVAPFSIARTMVTQADYRRFVEDGGYEDHRLWSDGGAWLASTGAKHPVYWRQTGDGRWQRRHFDQWVDLEPRLPVGFLSWWEADAYCRWAGRRLPTEAEWELAASGGEWEKPTYPWGNTMPTPEQAATDWLSNGPVDVDACAKGDSRDGVRQLIGNVWEWTASDFLPYPLFERDAYGDNSEQFFGARKVLRGGSWATRGRYTRSTLRNYFTPERRDVLVGIRTCAVN